jgi:hypothetical protein
VRPIGAPGGADSGEGRPDGTGEAGATTEPVVLTSANEFAQVRVSCLRTRNGARLLIESLKSSTSIALCPLELEALTWQEAGTFSTLLGQPFSPLDAEDRP